MARRREIFRRDPDSDSEAGVEPAVEQRAIAEILALEEALERTTSEAATKLAELEQRLAESEQRVSAAERKAAKAHAKSREVERLEAAPPVPETSLAAELRLRTEQLEQEREEKTRLIEESDRRLAEIEERAVAAAKRVTTAEAELAKEAERLQAEANGLIAAEAERARKEASAAADARVRDLERELERAQNQAASPPRPHVKAPTEEQIAAITARIVRVVWSVWARWGAPLLAWLRSCVRPAKPPN